MYKTENKADPKIEPRGTPFAHSSKAQLFLFIWLVARILKGRMFNWLRINNNDNIRNKVAHLFTFLCVRALIPFMR